MRLIRNSGADRVLDELKRTLVPGSRLDVASPAISLFAFAELRQALDETEQCRVVLPAADIVSAGLLGSDRDRAARNRLHQRWLARQCARWIRSKVDVRTAPSPLPQSALAVRGPQANIGTIITGNCPFTTEGLGVVPGNQFSLIQCSENEGEWVLLSGWFSALWESLGANSASEAIAGKLDELVAELSPALVYHQILEQVFSSQGGELDEDSVIKSATGIRETAVWKKLFRFQRDGVVGVIDRLNRFGGCILADSVGLGKTFEALAVIKYHELRNDRVLVLCPKRLRDNWTLYKSNDRRNVLAADRLHYDVLNHTDLSREGGLSGDIDLSYVNWGNYDLVVIDESHNFRNKAQHRDRDTRYDHLMKRIIKAGVRTKVLMLSATPVNSRLSDLKNQIAFATEANDAALRHEGIPSIETTIRLAQTQFNRWLALPEATRKPARLIEMLGFDYFKLLDLLTIARSRKHVARYYGTEETGRFPDRLAPINVKADVDAEGRFPPIRDVNNEIRRLNLAAYAPLRYVLPNKQAAYDAKYSTRLRGQGDRIFRQQDREESLIHLLRVNILKRMESSVASFALTLQRQLEDVTALLRRIDQRVDAVDELDIADIDIDDPNFEALLVGRGVRVLLQDMDVLRWRQELTEDRDRLQALLRSAQAITPQRDSKLAKLRDMIAAKVRTPINPGNRKVIVFTAFADTAEYLYAQLADWARQDHGVHTALVTGAGRNRSTLPKLRSDLASILSAFSPRSKERPEELAEDGEIDLLIATDCISEGQNLQDCDWLVNYDIHWNPVRIIQRFGRIDRIGSVNTRIQLANFWPNMQLEEYINLEQRVSGRMVLLDVSATGEENIIETQSGNQMNDLEYRRRQMEQLQERVIDLEDLSNGISITDLTLGDFRVELGAFKKSHEDKLARLPLGAASVVTAPPGQELEIPPGVIFCLRAASDEALQAVEPGYPLAPHYLVHVSDNGEVVLPHSQAKQILDRLKTLCAGAEEPDRAAWARFDRATRHGRDMEPRQRHLATAVSSIQGQSEERAVASLFTPGGTHARKGEFRGSDDFEVVAYLVILPQG